MPSFTLVISCAEGGAAFEVGVYRFLWKPLGDEPGTT